MNRSNRPNRSHGTGCLLPSTLLLALVACGGKAPQAADAAAGTVPAVAGPPGSPSMPAGIAGLRFNRLPVMDDTGGTPQLAYTVEVPDGWRGAGGVQWNDSAPCHADQVRVSWSARSPDGTHVFQILPRAAWQLEGSQNPADPCPVAGYRSARELLEAAAAQARPHARVLDYRDWPEKLAQMRRQLVEQAGDAAPGSERRVDAGHLLLAYAENGTEMREVLSAAVDFASRNGYTVAATRQFTSYRAPDGQLDFVLNDRIAGSLELDPQWSAASDARKLRNVQRLLGARRAGQR